MVHRCLEIQERTWCWSSPVRPLAAWKDSSIRQRLPGRGDRDGQAHRVESSSGGGPARRWCRCGGPARSAAPGSVGPASPPVRDAVSSSAWMLVGSSSGRISTQAHE